MGTGPRSGLRRPQRHAPAGSSGPKIRELQSDPEVVLADDMVEKAVSVVVAAAKTGKIGDGKVFVLPVEHAVRIRTEEIGERAV